MSAVRTTLLAALAALAISPAVAAASELKSFELQSRHVDPATPGGVLEAARSVPKVNVLLPDGYKPRAKRRYPVLWLLHGANGGTDSWIAGGIQGIKSLVGDFPGIVVMPDGGKFGMYMDWWNRGARGGPAWTTFHLKTLRRVIERRYRIRAARRWHALGGISMGGQGALRYAALLPGYFGSVAGFSAAVPDMQSVIAQGGIAVLPLAAGNPNVTYAAMFGQASNPYAEGNSPQALAPNYAHTRIYLTSGDGLNCPQDPINPQSIALDIVTETGIRSQQAPFAAAARAAGADVTERQTCGVHTFGVWDRAIPDAVNNWGFFKPVVNRSRRWTYRTVARNGEMWGMRFRFAADPDGVVDFQRAGRTLSGSGTGTVRIRGRRGCRFAGQLPFERRLPRPCRRH